MKGASGLTLLEVVISLAVLSVGVLAAAGLQASSLQATRTAQDLQRLNSMATSVVDSWRGRTLDQTTSTSFDCSSDGLACTVVVSPCATTGGGIACDLGTVAKPAAHSIAVTVTSADRSVSLQTVALR